MKYLSFSLCLISLSVMLSTLSQAAKILLGVSADLWLKLILWFCHGSNKLPLDFTMGGEGHGGRHSLTGEKSGS